MAEVFTIAGANGFGAAPSGWALTSKGNYGAPGGKKHPAAMALQASLVTLGKVVRDPALFNLPVDGFIGNDTAQALSLALSRHLGPGQLPPEFRQSFSAEGIAAKAREITALLDKEIARRGAPPAPKPVPVQKEVPVTPQVPAPSHGMSMAAWGALGLGLLVVGYGIYMFLNDGKGKKRRTSHGAVADFGDFESMP